jgi:hypothetical protein
MNDDKLATFFLFLGLMLALFLFALAVRSDDECPDTTTGEAQECIDE